VYITPTPVRFSSRCSYNEYIQGFVIVYIELDAIKMASHGGIPYKELHKNCNSAHALTLRLLMSYGAPILDVSRSHTTTQHSR